MENWVGWSLLLDCQLHCRCAFTPCVVLWLQAPFQDALEIDLRGSVSLRAFGGGTSGPVVEVTIGEIKSNGDVSKSRRQLSLALAVIEQIFLAVSSECAAAPASAPAPLAAAAAAAQEGTGSLVAGNTAAAVVAAGAVDYRLVGLIFVPRAEGQARGTNLGTDSLVRFSNASKVCISLSR